MIRIAVFFGIVCLSLTNLKSARAETSWLLGGQLGASVLLHEPQRWSPRFSLGVGLDALTRSGFMAAARLDARHDLDLRLFAGAGYAGSAARNGGRFPLSVCLGPALARDRGGDLRMGGSALLVWSLWLARAGLELQLDLTRALGRAPPTQDRAPWAVTLSMGIRVVPFTPWQTGH